MTQLFYVPPTITHIRSDGTKNVFTCLEKLGQGGFAVVYKVKHQNTNKIYAMKIISKQLLLGTHDKKTLEKLKNEIQIQKSLVHSNIVQSKISFSDEFNYYIALEYCPGKNVREYQIKSNQGHLSEPETRKILRDVLTGLVYIHNRKIIHYDLKLENFLIGQDGKVKIADFGLSTFRKKEEEKKNSSVCGTPNYMSPEILLKKDNGNSFASDIWSIGVAAFIMLTGKAPFAGTFREAIYENIKNCQFTFPPNISLSYEAKDFIKSILKFDPNKRPSAFDLIKHPFIKKHDSEPIQLYRPAQSPTKSAQYDNSEHVYTKPFDQIYSQFEPNDGFLKPQNIDQITSQFIPQTPNPYPQNFKGDENDIPLKKLPLNIQNHFEANKIPDPNSKKTFTMPRNFVVKHSFLRDDLAYLLANGTVGICFGDKSRIVMDPNEEFVQYYKNHSTPLRVIDLGVPQNIYSSVDEKISLVKKFARAFKKFKNLYDQSVKNTISSIPLHHVSSFIKKETSVLYKFSNKNVQSDFGDGKRLIIFSSTKKVCFSKSIKEKFVLFSQNEFSKMNSNSDEMIKYRKTKEMLNELARNAL